MIYCPYNRQNHQYQSKYRETHMKPMVNLNPCQYPNTHNDNHFKSQT